MEASQYRKNVMKTLSVKPAKLGLSLVSKNTEQTNLMHACIGVQSEVSEFLLAMSGFIRGDQLSKVNKTHVMEELGDIDYYLTVLSKTLKVKQISSKKKIKLSGTLLNKMLELLEVSDAILDLAKKTFYGPVMTEVLKELRNPKTGGTVEKLVKVTNKEAQASVLLARKEHLKTLVEKAMEINAALSYAILEQPIGPVRDGNISKLAVRYPAGFFDAGDREKADTSKEHEAIEESSMPKATPEAEQVGATA